MCWFLGKFFGFHYTDDSAMTLAIANSLIRQPAVAEDVHQFDAKDMAKGYTHSNIFLLLVLKLVYFCIHEFTLQVWDMLAVTNCNYLFTVLLYKLFMFSFVIIASLLSVGNWNSAFQF